MVGVQAKPYTTIYAWVQMVRMGSKILVLSGAHPHFLYTLSKGLHIPIRAVRPPIVTIAPLIADIFLLHANKKPAFLQWKR
jgi:hypothetical protein